MSSTMRIATIALLLTPVLLTGGCESTPLTAPQDGEILLDAAPLDVVLDPAGTPPVNSADVTLTATVFDARGIGQSGVQVTFITSGGTLASTAPAETNGNGIATQTLTLTATDPDSVQVLARSGTVESLPVTITKSEAGIDRQPTARIDLQPASVQVLNQDVAFDARTSSDPDGDTITCYQWEIEFTGTVDPPPALLCNPPDPTCEIVQRTSGTPFFRSYDTEQTLNIVLRVSTAPGLACSSAGPVEAESVFSPNSAFAFYEIACDPSAPVADAGSAVTTSVGVAVVLDGRGSFDDESGIVSYSWTCQAGAAPQAGTNCAGTSVPACTSCTYTTSGSKTATLRVENGCGDISLADAVNVTVNP